MRPIIIVTGTNEFKATQMMLGIVAILNEADINKQQKSILKKVKK